MKKKRRENPKRVGKRQILAAQVLERKVRAWQLRKMGASTRAIGKELGVSHAAVEGYLNDTIAELKAQCLDDAKKARAIDLERIDDALLLVNRLLVKDSTAQDPQLMLNALDRLRQFVILRKDTYGYSAPAKVAPVNPEGDESWKPIQKKTDLETLEEAERVIAFEKARLLAEAEEAVHERDPDGAGLRADPGVDPPAGTSNGGLPQQG